MGKSYFIFNAVVRPVASHIRLIGPARFYLPDTYPRSMIQIRKVENDGSMRLDDIHAYGMFTLGCQVYCSDTDWHSVELNLVSLGKSAKLPAAIMNR